MARITETETDRSRSHEDDDEEKSSRNGHDDESSNDRDGSSDEDEHDRSKKETDKNDRDKKPAGPPPYKRPVFWIVLGSIVVVGVIVGVIWWIHASSHESTDDAFVQAHYATVGPQVAGHVVEVAVEDNQDVVKGQLLVKIDPRDLDESRKQAMAQFAVAEGQVEQAKSQQKVSEAQAGSAKADVASAEASAEQAQNDLKRYEEAGTQAVSKQQLDTARANAKTSAAALQAAKEKLAAAIADVAYVASQVHTAEAQLAHAQSVIDNAKLQYSYTTITAPIDGRVTNRRVERGDYVQIGQAVMALVPREVYVIANYKETQLTNMRPGQSVEIKVDSYPGETFYGKVDSIQWGTGSAFSLLPPENATGNYVKVVQRVPVKIVFNSPPDKPLSPGMSVVPEVTTK